MLSRLGLMTLKKRRLMFHILFAHMVWQSLSDCVTRPDIFKLCKLHVPAGTLRQRALLYTKLNNTLGGKFNRVNDSRV